MTSAGISSRFRRATVIALIACALVTGWRVHSQKRLLEPPAVTGREAAPSIPAEAAENGRALSGKTGARDSLDVDRKLVRNPDGTTDEFRRSSNHSEIVRISKDASGSLIRQIIYRIGKTGRISGSQVFDPHGSKLADIRYGYRKDNGKLVEEQVFDAQAESSTSLSPVRRFIHAYNDEGMAEDPVRIPIVEKVPEQLDVATALLFDPFAGQSPDQGR